MPKVTLDIQLHLTIHVLEWGEPIGQRFLALSSVMYLYTQFQKHMPSLLCNNKERNAISNKVKSINIQIIVIRTNRGWQRKLRPRQLGY